VEIQYLNPEAMEKIGKLTSTRNISTLTTDSAATLLIATLTIAI
jgi:hypothetical protein